MTNENTIKSTDENTIIHDSGNVTLTKLTIDMMDPESARLADCQQAHRLVMSLFPHVQTDESARASAGILYTLTGNTILIQSRTKPVTDSLPWYISSCETRDISVLPELFENGTYVRFATTVNTIVTRGGGERKGCRFHIREPRERLEWLRKRMKGAEICAWEETGNVVRTGWRRGSGLLKIRGENVSGVLRITDKDEFRKIFLNGIGKGRAYGFGMIRLSGFEEADA